MGETFGRRVYEARLALQAALGREVTQAEVGKAVGVTGQAVGLWETGKSQPKLEVIVELARFLRTDAAYLAFGIVKKEGNPEKVAPGTPGAIPLIDLPTAPPAPRPAQPDPATHGETLRQIRERKAREQKKEKKGRRKRA
jgi:DNA-binding XRE family transcriptional regulator